MCAQHEHFSIGCESRSCPLTGRLSETQGGHGDMVAERSG